MQLSFVRPTLKPPGEMDESRIQEIAGILRQATNSLQELLGQPGSASLVTSPAPSQGPSTSRQTLGPPNQPRQTPGPPNQPRQTPIPEQPAPAAAQSGGTSNIRRFRSLFRRGDQQSTQQQSNGSRSGTTSRGNPSPAGLQRQRTVRRRTFSRRVVCLANREDIRVPKHDEKAHLRRCGLGEKSVSFPVGGDEEEVAEALSEAFPRLRGCGGFELMRTEDGSRTKLLVVSVGPCPAEDIKSFSTDRFYLRPIQADFDVEEDDMLSHHARERCQHCLMDIPLHLLRDHVDECTGLLQAFPQCKELLIFKPVVVMRTSQFLSMFVKQFSESGTNDRMREENTIRMFVRYLRDVEGRRRCVSIADITQFITCLRTPPVVGFQPKPTIVFQPSRSFLPRAQTCSNTLILPVCRLGEEMPPTDVVAEMFDYAFKNDYFGAV